MELNVRRLFRPRHLTAYVQIVCGGIPVRGMSVPLSMLVDWCRFAPNGRPTLLVAPIDTGPKCQSITLWPSVQRVWIIMDFTSS